MPRFDCHPTRATWGARCGKPARRVLRGGTGTSDLVARPVPTHYRVHHQRLLERLRQRVRDSRILDLVKRMLTAKVVMPDGTKVATIQGTPQGGPLSPLLSNIVLDEWDRELGRRGLRFVRYADDCNIFVRSRRAGRRVMESTRRFLEQKLRLQINEEKSSVTTPGKVHFLGFRFKIQSNNRVAVLLSAKTKAKLLLKIRELTPRSWGQSLRNCFEKINEYFRGWIGHFRICTEERSVRIPEVRCTPAAQAAGHHHSPKETGALSVPSSPETGS